LTLPFQVASAALVLAQLRYYHLKLMGYKLRPLAIKNSTVNEGNHKENIFFFLFIHENDFVRTKNMFFMLMDRYHAVKIPRANAFKTLIVDWDSIKI